MYPVIETIRSCPNGLPSRRYRLPLDRSSSARDCRLNLRLEISVMELDITTFVQTAETGDFYGSVVTHGANAGRDTWNAAKREAASSPLLTTGEQFDAFRDHAAGFGAWDDAEIAAWGADELNALLIQMISGDMAEMPTDDNGEIDWAAAESESSNGTISGRLYRGDIEGSEGFGRVYYYLGD